MNIDNHATFWMVWNPAASRPTFQHSSEAKARAEAERLARVNPRNLFVVLRAIASYQKGDVRVTELTELPF